MKAPLDSLLVTPAKLRAGQDEADSGSFEKENSYEKCGKNKDTLFKEFKQKFKRINVCSHGMMTLIQ